LVTYMNIVHKLRLAPGILALALLVAGCGLQIPDLTTVTGDTDQAVPGSVVAGGQGWKVMPSPTLTLTPGATATRWPSAVPSQTASATPVPTETPVPLALDPACLVGTWEAANLAQAMAESIPMTEGGLKLEGVEGQVQYIFSQDGTMEIRYQRLAALMTGLVDGREVRVVQTLEGSGTASYQVDPQLGIISLSAFGGDGIISSLSINEQVLAEGSLPVWQAFTAGPVEADPNASPPDVQISRAAGFCQGDALTLQAVEPIPGPLVNLFRAP
jgi:hypothetical protein